MRHILARHSLEYWDGSVSKTQSFFRPGMSIDQIQDVIGDVLSQNRESIIADPSEHEWRLSGTSAGVRYDLSTYQSRIAQLVPLP